MGENVSTMENNNSRPIDIVPPPPTQRRDICSRSVQRQKRHARKTNNDKKRGEWRPAATARRKKKEEGGEGRGGGTCATAIHVLSLLPALHHRSAQPRVHQSRRVCIQEATATARCFCTRVRSLNHRSTKREQRGCFRCGYSQSHGLRQLVKWALLRPGGEGRGGEGGRKCVNKCMACQHHRLRSSSPCMTLRAVYVQTNLWPHAIMRTRWYVGVATTNQQSV